MILLVEDNPNARGLLARILSKARHQVIQSEDSDQARHVFDDNPIELVITDWRCPI